MLLVKINYFFPSFKLETESLFHVIQLATLQFENYPKNKGIQGNLKERHI